LFDPSVDEFRYAKLASLTADGLVEELRGFDGDWCERTTPMFDWTDLEETFHEGCDRLIANQNK
jgi:hypothetical protein